MILKNNLYTIEKKEIDAQTVSYYIILNANHIIFKSHFPDNPITPGVCILQIGKELLEDYMDLLLEIKSIKNVKFLEIISPIETPNVKFVITHTLMDIALAEVKARIAVESGEQSLAKISFTCKLR